MRAPLGMQKPRKPSQMYWTETMKTTLTHFATSTAGNTRKRNAIGALALSLMLPACASNTLKQPVRTEIIETSAPRLKISPDLLSVQNLTPRPSVDTNGDLEDWAEITDTDHRRDRGHLNQLVGAVKQQEIDQEDLDALALENAELKREAIEKANEATVKQRRPLLWFLGL